MQCVYAPVGISFTIQCGSLNFFWLLLFLFEKCWKCIFHVILFHPPMTHKMLIRLIAYLFSWHFFSLPSPLTPPCSIHFSFHRVCSMSCRVCVNLCDKNKDREHKSFDGEMKKEKNYIMLASCLFMLTKRWKAEMTVLCLNYSLFMFHFNAVIKWCCFMFMDVSLWYTLHR